jgi:hypothetical protein
MFIRKVDGAHTGLDCVTFHEIVVFMVIALRVSAFAPSVLLAILIDRTAQLLETQSLPSALPYPLSLHRFSLSFCFPYLCYSVCVSISRTPPPCNIDCDLQGFAVQQLIRICKVSLRTLSPPPPTRTLRAQTSALSASIILTTSQDSNSIVLCLTQTLCFRRHLMAT